MEVWIVLAIVALAIFVVFYAVPALQRNARNNQRRNDVSRLLAAVNEYASTNKGVVPNDTEDTIDLVETSYYSGEGTGLGQIKATRFTNYTLNNPFSETESDDRVHIIIHAQCSGNTAVAGTLRSFAALYQVETTTGYEALCQES